MLHFYTYLLGPLSALWQHETEELLLLSNIQIFFSYAGQLSVGNEVLIERNDKLTNGRVMLVEDVTLQGLYLNLNIIFFVLERV